MQKESHFRGGRCPLPPRWDPPCMAWVGARGWWGHTNKTCRWASGVPPGSRRFTEQKPLVCVWLLLGRGAGEGLPGSPPRSVWADHSGGVGSAADLGAGWCVFTEARGGEEKPPHLSRGPVSLLPGLRVAGITSVPQVSLLFGDFLSFQDPGP